MIWYFVLDSEQNDGVPMFADQSLSAFLKEEGDVSQAKPLYSILSYPIKLG